VPDLFLDIGDGLAGIGLMPAPVQVLRGEPELDDEVARKVLRLDLTSFLPPEPEQGRFVSEPPMKVRLLPRRALFLRYSDMIRFPSKSKQYLRYYTTLGCQYLRYYLI
jgi:hypothetical protein